MKTDTRHYLGWGARLRLVGRILGITALFVSLGGFFLLWAVLHEVTVGRLKNTLLEATGAAFVGALLFVVGGAFALLILLVELFAWLGGSGRRSATGLNAAAQVALALGVFGLLNALSFDYFKRWDLTRDREFTLPKAVASELRQLGGRTTIVVLQQHKTFGRLSEKPDIYDYAAERKVVDKVEDLVQQFRLLGPQFRVVTLDVEAIGYQTDLEAETATRPGLKEAIAAAPENSIFFYPDDQVQTLPADEARRREALGRRMHTAPLPKEPGTVLAYAGNIPRLSFNEFYQLDKTASRAANPGPDGTPRGNLVLRPQGVESFARRVLAIQEKRPKVGLLVIHEVLTSAPSSAARDMFTAAGLRQSLEAHGFEVVDIVLKKWNDPQGPQPAAYTLGETQFDRLAAELEGLDEERRELADTRKDGQRFLQILREKSIDELNQMLRPQLRRDVTEEWRQVNLKSLGDQLKQIDERIAEIDQERRETDLQLSALLKNERAFEDRRVADVKAKLSRLVADCDLLILPRITVLNASALEYIDATLFRLSSPQAEVLKDFMKAGKPVMVCAGPSAEEKDPEAARRDRENPPAAEPMDDVERLLAERGVILGRETIITNAEAKGFAARRAGGQLGGAPTDIPPVSFPDPKDGRDNPVAAAMRATEASVARPLEIRIQDPRPIYVAPALADKLGFPPTFLLSPAASWNEASPMVARNLGLGRRAVVPPRFHATPFNDPRKDTFQEVRRGPFPIGVAVEAPLPVEWFDRDFAGYRKAAALAAPIDGGLLAACLSAEAAVEPDKETKAIGPQTKRPTSRLVVIGHGGLFNGKELTPAQEQLLLHTCNWLLNRNDRLPSTAEEWRYPRVNRDERTAFLWKYGPFLGLPAFFLYLGLIVWIVRRVR